MVVKRPHCIIIRPKLAEKSKQETERGARHRQIIYDQPLLADMSRHCAGTRAITMAEPGTVNPMGSEARPGFRQQPGQAGETTRTEDRERQRSGNGKCLPAGYYQDSAGVNQCLGRGFLKQLIIISLIRSSTNKTFNEISSRICRLNTC